MKNIAYTIKTHFWTIAGLIAISGAAWYIARVLIGSEGFAYNLVK